MKLLTLLSAFACVASAALQGSSSSSSSSHDARAPAADHVSTRPQIVPSPKQPRLPVPNPPNSTRVCTVETHGDGVTDDSAFVLAALHSCNRGGHVVFSADTTYTIGKVMDLSFLSHIDIDVQGTVKFTDDTDYWQANSIHLVYQNTTTFFKLGGDNVFIYGGGTLDGSGQAWYDLYASDIYILRPVLFGIDGLHDSIIADIHLQYSPIYYFVVANSTNVVFDGISIVAASSSKNLAKNTDGWDTYRSSDITIQNSVIANGDDCVSFKPNSTYVLVQSLSCTGSHGISVGSLGQVSGTYDIVEHVWVANVSLHNTSDGARIKTWPNAQSALSGDLQGGGGSGRVNNVTYDGLFLDNVDYAIEVTQCYGQKNLTLCTEHPSLLTISNIVFRNFQGTTSKKYSPQIASLACSAKDLCSSISASAIDVKSPSGENLAFCLNLDEASLDVTCTDTSKGFN